jgi:hypothetical protein
VIVNGARFVPGQRDGHYESYYQRANHPTRPLAFWIRYTMVSPARRPEAAIGELWAMFFNGETGEHLVTKEEYPIAACDFATDAFAVRIGNRTLGPGSLTGTCDTISWNLTYSGDEPPLFLLPARMYRGGFPKAKSLVGLPLARYRGRLKVGGSTVTVKDWVGSQNHNWGSRHTDRYAFGQVAGFDDAPGSFLEMVTAQARIGPARTPWLTFLVLRHEGREHRCRALRAAPRYTGDGWDFAAHSHEVAVEGRISAPPETFVELTYLNPSGGTKGCRNSQLAVCELTLTERRTGARRTLTAGNRALFETLR